MKVLIVSHMFPSMANPHMGIFLRRQVEYLSKHGIDSYYLVPRAYAPWPLTCIPRWRHLGSNNKLLLDDITNETKTCNYFRPSGAWYLKYEGQSIFNHIYKTAKKWHQKEKFDAILSVPMIPDAQAAVLLGQKLDLPVAALAIGSDIMVYPEIRTELWPVLTETLSRLDKIIGVSQEICRRMSEKGQFKSEPECVYLSRDTSHFSFSTDLRKKVRRDIGIKDEEVVGIFVGNMIELKGVYELTDAFQAICQHHSNARLICIGDGPAKKRLQQIDPYHNKIHHIGRVKPNEVINYLCAADYMIFPSHSEGMPQAVLEAMSCRLPVIGTRVGGIPEAIEDDLSGYLIDAGNSRQLSDAMSALICDRNLREKLGERALEIIKKKFDPNKNAMRFANILKSMI